MMNSRSIGDGAELVQIIEFHAPTHDAQVMLPDASPALFQANEPLLANRFWIPRTNRHIFTYQLWLLKLGGAIVLVDTGCGNRKQRISPYQNDLNTPVIDWLRAVDAPPEKITHVVHTHIHGDHVGWNTVLVGGRWEPTFPNAVYCMPRLDYDLFRMQRARAMGPESYEQVLLDSVEPVVEAGLVRFVEDGDEVAGLVALATPGHTPGHLAYVLRNAAEEIIFAGDVLHSPLQVVSPMINSRWCEDAQSARETRHMLLNRAADRGASIIPAHARQIDGWRVSRSGDGYAIGFAESSTITARSASGRFP